MNYNRNASNFYKLKALILMLQFFPDFLHIQTAREYKFADEKQKDKKPVPCSSKTMSNEKIICRDYPDSFIIDVPPYVFCCTGQI